MRELLVTELIFQQSTPMTASKFVTNLTKHFSVFFKSGTDEAAEWIKSMIGIVGVYDDAVLGAAFVLILRTRKETRFPLPAEIIAVCDSVVQARNRKPMAEKMRDGVFDGHSAPPHSRARTALVLDLLRGEMGREAARDGWIGSLVDHVRYAKELPDGSMIRTIKARAVEFQEIRERCHHGVGWPSTPQGRGLARACAIWGDTIEARNRLWSRVILGQEDEESIFRRIEKDEDLQGAA